MSVLLEIDNIPITKREQLANDLRIKPLTKGKKYSSISNEKDFDCYEVIDDMVVVPFAYAFHNLISTYPNDDRLFPKIEAKFNLELFDRQKELRTETFQILNDFRSLTLALPTGYGKSLYALYIACKIGLKTIIYVHRIIIADQWVTYIKRACGEDTKYQIVNSTCNIDHTADFYIVNFGIPPKRDRADFANIGTLIVDEAHAIATQQYSKCLAYSFPKWIMFLTATPERSDGQDTLLGFYTGPCMIRRSLWIMMNIYILNTGFKPTIKKTDSGGLNWNAILESQSMDKSRNILIIDLVKYFTTRNILILCKRKSHASILLSGLKKYNLNVDCYMGSQRYVNYNSQILVATYSKGGVGFDHPKLDMLIVAADVKENYIQYIGRILRKDYNFPIVIDLVDSFKPLQNHSKSRNTIAENIGGEIKLFHKHYPEFIKWRKIFSTNIDNIYDELQDSNKE
jgi:superfamily II DNA or RNA helicase